MEFSDLALAKFLQTAPELGPTILNFSDISQEVEGQGVQVGLFILRTGAGIVLVPVVSKGDTVFPIDSVFLQDESRFLPLTQNTIRKLMTTSPMSIGKSKSMPKSMVQNPDISALVNPPRTGKFVYASTSRLTEFLASLPDKWKKFTFEKIASEASVYDSLDKMFGLKSVFEVLKSPSNTGPTGPTVHDNDQYSVITTPREVRDLFDEVLAEQFMNSGYAITGSPTFSRIAVAFQPYESGVFTNIDPDVDYGKDYSIVLSDGTTKPGYLPKYHMLQPVPMKLVVFSDGTYATGKNLISSGQLLKPLEVLNHLFAAEPPKLLKECIPGENILLMTSEGECLGPFYVDRIALVPDGAEVHITGGYKVTKIYGSKNLSVDVDSIGKTLYVKHNVIVISLGEDITRMLEHSVSNASTRNQLITSQYLGSDLDIRHDGIEYSINGAPVGGLPEAMKRLVEGEEIAPDVAGNFLKQAQEIKYLKVFLSKKAAQDIEPGEVQATGQTVFSDDYQNVGLNGSFMPAVNEAEKLQDSQTMEATIISQLLQAPDLFENIQEYLPDLKDAVDKLGRLLFLSRVKIDQLVSPLDSDSVFALISQVKNVYRQLGDTTSKLEEVAGASIGYEEEGGNKKENGV